MYKKNVNPKFLLLERRIKLFDLCFIKISKVDSLGVTKCRDSLELRCLR